MILLICNSNMFVPGVVTRILKSPQDEFVIYTDMEGMEKFFKEMAFPNAVVLRYPNAYSLTTLRKVKKYILNQLSPYKIDRIEFYHAEGGHIANWLITKYSKRCEVFYCPPFEPMPMRKIKGIKRWKLILLDRLLYHYEADPLWVGNAISTSIAPSFFKENCCERGIFDVDLDLNFKYLQSQIPELRSDRKVILLTGGIIETGAIPEEYDYLNRHIIEVIGENKIVTKCHPLFDDEYGVEKKLGKIPSYIPFNMIIPMFDVVISFASASLAEAAEAGKKAISTAFLLPFYNMDRRQANYEALVAKNTGDKKVHYPKTYDELDKLLMD